MTRPNILFLMADSLVARLTGIYGNGAGATPNLDRLAAEGVVFENAYCNSPLCAPSRASLVTGRYVSDIGCLDNANEFLSEWPTIGHALGAAGYETAIVGKMHFIGCDQHHGFDHRIALEADYSLGHDPGAYRMAADWDGPLGGNPEGNEWMGPSYVASDKWDRYLFHYERDETIHREALAHLGGKTADSAPFFCCASYHAPHNPFWIPEEFRARFRNQPLPLPSVPEGMNTCHGPMDEWLNAFHFIPEIEDRLLEPDNLRWLYETYFGVVADFDRRVGELLETLEKQGLRESTAVVLTSDHGDMLGERGMIQKRYLYEASVRVPLVFSWPGHWPAGARLRHAVSLVDLLPTFAAMAGTAGPEDAPGLDLLPSVRHGSEPDPRIVFSEYHGEGVRAPCFMAVEGPFKYLYVHGYEERLYHLEDDPGEFHNLIDRPEHRPRIARLKEALLGQFDVERIAAEARRSQRNRRFVYRSLEQSGG
jgi:choline-sulfatase